MASTTKPAAANEKMLTVRVSGDEHMRFSRTILDLSYNLDRRVSGNEILRKLVNRISSDPEFAKEIANAE